MQASGAEGRADDVHAEEARVRVHRRLAHRRRRAFALFFPDSRVDLTVWHSCCRVASSTTGASKSATTSRPSTIISRSPVSC
jgi:hypothetical protein